MFRCRTSKSLISNWPRTWKFSQLLQAGKTVSYLWLFLSHLSHALVTLYFQFLCSDWSKFDRWVHVENLCSILKLVYFDSWSWQSFVSTCDVFNCLFPLDVQNEIQLLSGVFCYSWLVCLLGFWLGNMSLVKVGNPISDGVIFVFGLAWCVRGLKSLKRFCPYLIAFRSYISNGKPEWLLYSMFAFYILFNEVEHSLCSYLVYARRSRAILALECDWRWLLFFGCTYKAINSM